MREERQNSRLFSHNAAIRGREAEDTAFGSKSVASKKP